jgi:predicted nucleic acid-binding protein
VSEVVLDASVVLKWFRSAGERHVDAARALRTAYEAGELLVFAPPLLHLEILNVAGRRWRLGEEALVALAVALEELGFELMEPPLERVAHWIARGLTAYDAAYAAVAEAAAVKLVSDDALILALARDVAEPLAPTSTT